jgi:hypothetical protein
LVDLEAATGGVLPDSASFVCLCYRRGFTKQNGALLIAACIIAVRLRGEPIQPSPKLKFVISESVQLAKLVLQELHLQPLTTIRARVVVVLLGEPPCNHEHPLVLPHVMHR